MRPNSTSLLLLALLLALAPTAVASTTWYVNGVTGSDSNDCKSATTACKTIRHAISLASSGDSIKVAAATYKENLTLGFSVTILGSNARTTIIDGGGKNPVITISKNARTNVTLSRLTIQNGYAPAGGGIRNFASLTVNECIIRANTVYNLCIHRFCYPALGSGIYSFGGVYGGAFKVVNSTISGNYHGIGSLNVEGGSASISNSTISGNDDGIVTGTTTLSISNSTISGNSNGDGVKLIGGSTVKIGNSTINGNVVGIFADGPVILQDSIVANSSNGNCGGGAVTSQGYNLSSDNTCNFNNAGDLNNTDPMLGPLQNNGGPTQTMALPSGSPALDAGNPNGCTDSNGVLLKTDQRGKPRPDKEDNGGCDMGAYESQND